MKKEDRRPDEKYHEVKILERKLQSLEKKLRVQKNKAKRKAIRREINELKIDLGWMLMDQREFEQGLLLYQSLPWESYGEIKYNVMARALTEMGFYDEAQKLLKAGLMAYPKSYILWMAMAALYETTGDYLSSLECIEKSLEFAPPNDSMILYIKSSILMRIGYYGEAKEIIDKFIERDPEDLKYLTMKGLLSLEMGYPQEALRYYQEALERWQKDQTIDEGISIYSGLSSVYLELGMKREAMEVALEGLRRFPDEDPVLYHNVGAIFYEMGWQKEALDILMKGIEKFPEDEEMKMLLKEIEDDLNDPDRGNNTPLIGFLLLMALLFKRMRRK